MLLAAVAPVAFAQCSGGGKCKGIFGFNDGRAQNDFNYGHTNTLENPSNKAGGDDQNDAIGGERLGDPRN